MEDKPIRVLIAEDSREDTELMIREFKRCGYHPDYARVDTPLGMVNALDQGEWDVLIGDHSIPHLRTLDVLTLLKENKPDLPYIIVSGTIDEEAAAAALKAGASDFLRKDDLTRLIPAVERELKQSDLKRGLETMRKQIESLKENNQALEKVIEILRGQ